MSEHVTTNPTEIFLVTSGCYSDYYVVCAFTSRELAEAYAERLNRAEYERERGPAWSWAYGGDTQTFVNWMTGRDGYRARAEAIQMWDTLPVVEGHDG